MGTRADYYVQLADGSLDWLGSTAWDGYPGGIDEAVLAAESEADFKAALETFLSYRDDATRPHKGWPWPWNDSDTTDYAYVFVPGVGVVHRESDYTDFKGDFLIDQVPYFYVRSVKILNPDPDWVADEEFGHAKNAAVTGVAYDYPDMSARQNVTFGDRSGIIVVSG